MELGGLLAFIPCGSVCTAWQDSHLDGLSMSWRDKTYEVLPALSVRGKELRHSLRLVTVAWMWGVVWMTCISGDQMRSFAKMLGFNDFAFGLLGAIPFLATLGQLFAALIVERTGLRKFVFMDTMIVSRAMWVVIALVPIVFFPGREGSATAVAVALMLLAATNLMAHMATPPWWTWMGDLIPRRIRGRYFARRAQWATLVQVVVIVVISLSLDYIAGGRNPGNENAVENYNLLVAICIIFAVGSIFGIIDVALFRKVREVFPPHDDKPRKPTFDFHVPRPKRLTPLSMIRMGGHYTGSFVNQVLLDPLGDRVFRHYVCYGAALTFTMTVGGWYFWLHCRENLGFNTLASNCLFLVIGPLSATLTAGWWGKLIDRWGRRPVLIVATIATAISTLPWFVADRGNPSPQFVIDWINGAGSLIGGIFGHGGMLLLDEHSAPLTGAYLLAALGCIIGGSAWTGVSLAQQAIILGFSDGGGRNKYVAASSVLINLGGVLGGIVGGLTAEYFKGAIFVVGPLLLNNYHLTFALGMFVRLISLFWLYDMPDPGSRKVRDMLKYVSENAYNAVAGRLFYPLRVFGWGGRASKPNGETNKERRSQ